MDPGLVSNVCDYSKQIVISKQVNALVLASCVYNGETRGTKNIQPFLSKIK
jgi:hypothetical protein